MISQKKLKLNSIIEPDIMARIESIIEKRVDMKNLGHMREHVERRIEGLEYLYSRCNKMFGSSHTLREHKKNA